MVPIHQVHESQHTTEIERLPRLEDRCSSDFEQNHTTRLSNLLCRLRCISRYYLDFAGNILGALFQQGKMTLKSFPHSAMSDCIFVKVFSVRVRLRWCNERNSSFVARIGIMVWYNAWRSRLRPRLLIVVCPLCLPELFELRFKPAYLISCRGSLNRRISPISLTKMATATMPTP